ESGFLLHDYEKIAGKDVLIFSCPVNDALENELEDIIMACKQQYNARSVTVIFSFMRYRRQDHIEIKSEVTRLRWFIFKLKQIGADRLVIVEPHSIKNTAEFCAECGMELHICDPTPAIADAVKNEVLGMGLENSVIFSPDFGSVGRSINLAKSLGICVIASPKKRLFGDEVTVENNFDEIKFLQKIHAEYGYNAPVSCDIKGIKNKNIWIREDEISTGGTAIAIADKLRLNGAKSVNFIATHPVCTYGWKIKLFPPDGRRIFDSVWLGDTRPRGNGASAYQESTSGRINRVAIAPVLAKTLANMLPVIA
ncbi:MAG: hypothetical protein WC323_04165, partial [Patescibacteria group bacterium]